MQEMIQVLEVLHQPVAVVEHRKVEQVELVVLVVEQEILTRILQVQVEQLVLQVKVMLVVAHFVEPVVVEVVPEQWVVMRQVLLQVHLLQELQEKVVKVEQELLQELQDQMFKEVVVEVVEHNIHPHNQEALAVVEQVVQVKVGLHLLRLVQQIQVVVEVVTKTDLKLEEQVVVD
jgi:hypothetical protein|tara:strand:- start:145 stop:669 length:525 start_codon:yes stop_codon:yes gene_type:complete